MKSLLFIISILIAINSNGQFTTMFNDTINPFGLGGYNFDGVCEDDSFYYALGGINNFQPNWQLMLLKMDKNSNIIKKRKYGDTNIYYAAYPYNSIILDNNNLLFTFTLRGADGKDLSIIYAINKHTLDTLWTRVYTHPDTLIAQTASDVFSVLTAIKSTPDGGYILTGNYNKDCITGNLRSFLMKIDSVGNVEWRRAYNSYYTFFDIEIADDSGYFVPSGFNGTNALQLVKFDRSGIYQWRVGVTTNTMAGYPMTIAIQDSSHVILSFYHLYDVANYRTAVIATKVNTQTRSVDWEKDYYPYQNFECVSLHQAMGVETLSDGSIIISGTSSRYGHDAVILKLNSNGDSLWCKSYDFEPDPYDCQLNDLIVCDDGGFMGVGFFDDQAGPGSAAWMFKTDANGVVGWESSTPLSAQKFKVWPNPAKDFTTISITQSLNQESEIIIYNSLGQIEKTLILQKQQREIEVDVQGFTAGLYFYELRAEDMVMGVGKFVVE